MPESVGPPLPAGDVQDLAKLVDMAKEGFSLVPVAGQDAYQLQRQRSDIRLKLKPLPEEAGKGDPATRQKYYQSLAGSKERVGVIEGSMTVTFFLRSPEALLYYLGELARVENRQGSPKVPEVCIQDRYQPLFVAFPGGKCPGAILSADSGEGAYSVPRWLPASRGRLPARGAPPDRSTGLRRRALDAGLQPAESGDRPAEVGQGPPLDRARPRHRMNTTRQGDGPAYRSPGGHRLSKNLAERHPARALGRPNSF